ncbi:MAG: phosphoenolpyruvate carboxylase [Desulfobacteraceae bacterium]|nr:phosphoenolpyruvate carboxylase [Desulfobacteraceae bacterium]
MLLERELLNPRPLTSCYIGVSDSAESLLKTFGVIRESFHKDRRAVGSYLVRKVCSVSDMLEVLLLAKETGLWRIRNGKAESLLNIVPMFETVEDMGKAAQIMESLFINPVYALHLKAHQEFQEFMLNYSECAKDGAIVRHIGLCIKCRSISQNLQRSPYPISSVPRFRKPCQSGSIGAIRRFCHTPKCLQRQTSLQRAGGSRIVSLRTIRNCETPYRAGDSCGA